MQWRPDTWYFGLPVCRINSQSGHNWMLTCILVFSEQVVWMASVCFIYLMLWHVDLDLRNTSKHNIDPIYPRYRAGAASGLAEIEVISLRGRRKHTDLEWNQMVEAYMTYRCAMSKLGELALLNQQTRWRQRPKIHSLEHAVFDFNQKNLRYMANYLDEDFVRRSKHLACKSTPKFVSRHVLFRYSIAACRRWAHLDWWQLGRKKCVENLAWPTVDFETTNYMYYIHTPHFLVLEFGRTTVGAAKTCVHRPLQNQNHINL